MKLGERIREIRQAQKISQDRLAMRANVLRVTIARLESGAQATTNWENVARIARSFGMTVDELLKDVEIDMQGAAVGAGVCD